MLQYRRMLYLWDYKRHLSRHYELQCYFSPHVYNAL